MLRKNNKRMPDVLDCLANLSNDEVFTPPEVANRMLDLLPQTVFVSKETTFLDPFTKSGVFLREITKRLLAHQIPNYEEMSGKIDEIEKTAIQEAVKSGNLDLQDADYDEKAKKIGRDAISIHPRAGAFHEFEEKLQKELNRILKTQVFGIAITELTAQLTRRSLYCSKNASGKYSICEDFGNEAGNIRFKPCQHVWNKKPKWVELDKKWKGATCVFCGASSEMFDRPNDLEQHAYEFIHTMKAEEFFNMKFDVICGNPPYQLSDGGGTGSSAMPIYHKFIQQAKRLNPRFLTMIIPSRWFSGGKGLDDFRSEMLNDKRIREIHDFGNASDCFPGVAIEGGVCYFLWNRDNEGLCKVYTHSKDTITTVSERPLLEDGADVFIRYNEMISIIRKVSSFNEKSFSEIVSPRNPYYFKDDFVETKDEDVTKCKVLGVESGKRVYKKIDVKTIGRNQDELPKWKIFISKADGAAGQIGFPIPARIIGKSEIAEPNTACTETFLRVGPFDSETEAQNAKTYMETKFFRALVGARKNKNMTQSTYSFAPIQDFSRPWTDEELYKKYGLLQEEIDFIESMIKPMYENTEDKENNADEEE